MIIHFTIAAISGRQGIRTHPPFKGTALAERLGKPYPTTFRSSGPPGSRTPISGVQSRCRPVGSAARRRERTGSLPHVHTKVRPRIDLGLPPYQEVCCQNTCRPAG